MISTSKESFNPYPRPVLSKRLRWCLWFNIWIVCINVAISSGIMSSGATTVKASLGMMDLEYSCFTALYALGRMIGSLLFVTLINNVNRKYLLAIAIFIKSITVIVFKFSSDSYFLLGMRLISGICHIFPVIYGPIWVDQLCIQKYRYVMMACLSLSSSLGRSSGFIIDYIVGANNWRWGFLINGYILLICSIALFLFPSIYFSSKLVAVKGKEGEDLLRPSQARVVSIFNVRESEVDERDLDFCRKNWIIISNPVYIFCLLARLVVNSITSVLQFWIPNYVTDVIGYQNKEIKLVCYVFMICCLPFCGSFFGSYAADAVGGYSNKHSLVIVFIIYLFAALLFAPVSYMTEWYSFLGCCAAFLVCGSAVLPSLNGIILSSIPARLKAKGYSIANVAGLLLGSIPSPIIYGLLNDRYKVIDTHFSMKYFSVYAFVGVFWIVCAVISRYSLENNNKKKPLSFNKPSTEPVKVSELNPGNQDYDVPMRIQADKIDEEVGREMNEYNYCVYDTPAKNNKTIIDEIKEKNREINSGIMNFHYYPLYQMKNNSSNTTQSSINKEDPYSRGEECIQKDVLRAIDQSSFKQQTLYSINDHNSNSNSEDKARNKNSMNSNERFKNYILKSELKYFNDTNKTNSHSQPHSQIKPFPFQPHSKAQEIEMEKNKEKTKCNEPNLSNCLIDNSHYYNPYNLKLMPSVYSLYTKGQLTNINNSNIDDSVKAIDQSLPSKSIISNIVTIIKQSKAANHSNYEEMSIEEIVSNCYRINKEQQGCRFLQKIIDKYPKIVSELYIVIKDKIVELSCDVFGNYLIQKIIESLSIYELDDMIRGDISTYFNQIALNQYGTRVIQKFLSKIIISDSLLNTFNILLKPHLIDFAVDKNANHILIKYMSLIDSPRNDFIITELKNKLIEVANQKYSCYTLQRCIANSNVMQKKVLFYSIAQCSSLLFMEQYGHYVIEYTIKEKDKEINRLIINSYLNDFPKYSCAKYSSKVYERCIDYFDKDIKEMIIERLCNPVIVQCLLFDLFGNYVLQKTIQIAHEPFRSSYLNMICPLLNQLKNYSFGEKTISNLVTNYPELLYAHIHSFNSYHKNRSCKGNRVFDISIKKNNNSHIKR